MSTTSTVLTDRNVKHSNPKSGIKFINANLVTPTSSSRPLTLSSPSDSMPIIINGDDMNDIKPKSSSTHIPNDKIEILPQKSKVFVVENSSPPSNKKPLLETPPAPSKTQTPESIQSTSLPPLSNLSIPISQTIVAPPRLPISLRTPPKNKSVTLKSPPKAPSIISPTTTKHTTDYKTIRSPPSTIQNPSTPQVSLYDNVHPIQPIQQPQNIKTPKIEKREEIYKTTPPKESLSIPVVPKIPQVKVGPIGTIHGSSPTSRTPYMQQQTYQPQYPQQQYPQPQQQNNVQNVSRPNYNLMTHEEQEKCRMHFMCKFESIKNLYPERNITIPSETLALDVVHDLYENEIKQIFLKQNADDWEIYLFLMFFGVEVFLYKYLNIDTKFEYLISQFNNLSKYKRLLIELGEKNYMQAGSASSPEWKLLWFSAFQAIAFIIFHFLSKMLPGGDILLSPVRTLFSNMINGTITKEPIKKDECGIPIPPNMNNNVSQESPQSVHNQAHTQGQPDMGETIGNVIGMARNVFGNVNMNDMKSLATNVMGMINQNNNNNQQQKVTNPPIRRPTYAD